MLNRNQDADETAQEVANTIRTMLVPLQNQISEIQQAVGTAEDMRQVMKNVVSNAKSQLQTTQGKPQSVCNTIDTSIHTLNQRADKIGDMVEKGLLPAEDTASDNNRRHNIVSRLLVAIQQIAQRNKHHDTNAITVVTGAKKPRRSIDEPQQMAATVRVTIDEIGRLLGQFQVSARG